MTGKPREFERRGRSRRLFVREIPGAEPPLVFLHGLGATHRYWMARLPADGFGRRLVLPDLYGFGDSPRPWRRYTTQRHLDMLDGVLGHESRLILIGHSLGAALALAYAARRPEAVAGLVLISLPYYGDQQRAYRWFRRKPSGWLATNMAITALTCVFTRHVAIGLLPRLLPEFPREILSDLVKHNMFSSTTSLWDVLYRQDLAYLSCCLPEDLPVVCVHGSADETAPVATVRGLAARHRNWQFELLEGADHHPWLTQTGGCEAAIRGILEHAGTGH
jgi:pimeloyl-ACP methyl ester carboxylesterase